MMLNRTAGHGPGDEKGRVLVVDDEVELTRALVELLSRGGYQVTSFNDPRAALVAMDGMKDDPARRFDVLLADLMMPSVDGLALMRAAQEADPELVCILMTGQGTVQTAVDAMKSGAFDYILKPFKLNNLLTTLHRALRFRRLRQENVQLRELVNIYELGRRISSSLDEDGILRQTCQAALQVCDADEATILLPPRDEDGPIDPSLRIALTCDSDRQHLVGQMVPVTGTVSGWVAENMQVLSIDGPLDEERFPASPPRQEVRRSLSLPMTLGEKLAGVIHVNQTSRDGSFTPEQVNGLGILVNIAASAMENARLYQQTEKQLRRLAALRTVDQAISSSLDVRVTLSIVLDQATAELGAEMAAILLANPQSQLLVWAAGRGFRGGIPERMQTFVGLGCAGEAALERRTVLRADLTQSGSDPMIETLRFSDRIESMFATPLIAKGEVKGVMILFRPVPFQPDESWVHFFETLAGQAAIAIDSANLFETLQDTNQRLFLAYNSTIEGWSRALDLRDRETEGHTQRVTEMTLRLARSMGVFNDEDLVHIRRGALLHDIGKMGIPDEILHKPGELDEREEAVMRRHPEYAYQLLSPIAYLRLSLDIPYHHHERWDGSGYPLGLKGEQIPFPARIFAVVDVWDALRSNRPYRTGWPEPEVRAFLREQSGTLFDPAVVERFFRLLEEEEAR